MSETGQATDHEVLVNQITSPLMPKNEREWAAKREIEDLRAKLAQAEAEWVAWKTHAEAQEDGAKHLRHWLKEAERQRDSYRLTIREADKDLDPDAPASVKYGEYDEHENYRPPFRLPNIPDLERQRDEARAALKHTIHCPDCGGTWYDDGLTTGCPLCALKRLREGVGRLKAKHEPRPYSTYLTVCPICRGFGRQSGLASGIPCFLCQGRGRVEAAREGGERGEQ